MLKWSYGLAEFLHHSNEDVVCASFIGKLTARAMQRIWPNCTSFVRIADIGCGSGSKAVEIARYLQRRGLRTHWDLIDIDERWKPAIEENVQRAGNKNEMRFDVLCPLAAEFWIQSSNVVPHIAQFIHVPYDDESEEMIYNLTVDLTSKRSFILISAEHPQSDLNIIRRRFSKLGYLDLPSERTNSLAKRLRQRGLLVKEYVLGKKYLDIGPAGQTRDMDWLWDLIFGTKHNVKDKGELTNIIDELSASQYIPSLDARLLNLPDLLITVRQRA